MKKFIIYIIMTLGGFIVRGQDEKQITVSDKEYIIPFQLTKYNNISVQAILNKKDTVRLMFHTAANFLTLTEEATQKLESLHFTGSDDHVKSWGGGENISRYSPDNSLQIGELKWEQLTIWENKNSGKNTDGKFGIDLFANKVIEVDFDNNIIKIRSDLPKKSRKYEKLKLIFEDDKMFLEAACVIDSTHLKNRFLIHSGYSGVVLLDDDFANNNKVGEVLKIVDEKELKDSYGNILKTRKAIMPAFIIGNETLSDVPVGFFDGAIGRQKMSIIGGDIIRRFNLIIDAKRAYIYLKPNHLTGIEYTNI